MSDILATMTPRPARRWVATGIQVALGFLLILVALELQEGTALWRVLFGVLGAVVLFGALRLFRATAHRIELTETELRDSAGHVLAAVEDVTGVDRSAFAFKPSNGFLVHLARPGPRRWVPGLWWRMGRFVGVGGATPRHEAKLMAEMLAALIAERGR